MPETLLLARLRQLTAQSLGRAPTFTGTSTALLLLRALLLVYDSPRQRAEHSAALVVAMVGYAAASHPAPRWALLLALPLCFVSDALAEVAARAALRCRADGLCTRGGGALGWATEPELLLLARFRGAALALGIWALLLVGAVAPPLGCCATRIPLRRVAQAHDVRLLDAARRRPPPHRRDATTRAAD